MTAAVHGGARPRISEEIRSKILAADPAIPHRDLAHEFGISDVSVYTIRKKGGIALLRTGKKKAKKSAKAKPPNAAPPPVDEAETEDAGDEPYEVTLRIPGDRATDIFVEFTEVEKMQAIQFVLQERMDAALAAVAE